MGLIDTLGELDQFGKELTCDAGIAKQRLELSRNDDKSDTIKEARENRLRKKAREKPQAKQATNYVKQPSK